MQTIEIIVNKKIERTPLSIYGKYFKLYLPDDIVIKENQCKQISLNFKIELPDNIIYEIIPSTLLRDQPIEIIGKLLTSNCGHKEIVLKLINRKDYFTFKFSKNLEVAKLHFFEKIHTLYKHE